MSFIFYDTETTGKRAGFDQILQFGAVLTDDELNVMDSFAVRCRLAPHIVPSPEAMLVTGVSVDQMTRAPLTHFEMMRQIRAKAKNWCDNEGAIFVGWNSLRFDEVMLRQNYYQTLLPIYQTNTNGNGRGDVMRMTQIVAACAPGAIQIPIGDKGKPSFKLGDIASANGIGLDNAHDALADTRATLAVAQLIKRRTPSLWDAMIANTKKAAPLGLLRNNATLFLSETYGGVPFNLIVSPIARNPSNANEWALFDLQFDPKNFFDVSDDELRNSIDGKPKIVRRISINAQPSIFPVSLSPDNVRGGRLPLQVYQDRANALREQITFRQRIARLFGERYADQESPSFVEQRIYDGFPAYADEALMVEFHKCEWPRRADIVTSLEDKRFRELGERLIACECPDMLTDGQRRQWRTWRRDRLLGEGDVPWLTIANARTEIVALRSGADSEQLRQLTEIDQFFIDTAKTLNL
jgi:exodeoxyribonuclease-1